MLLILRQQQRQCNIRGQIFTHQNLVYILVYEDLPWEEFREKLCVDDEVFHQEGHRIPDDIAMFTFHLHLQM